MISQQQGNDSKTNQVKKDLKLSVLTGPLTITIPVVSYLLLYPIILSRSSIEVLGIWSLYVTTASFFTVADVGFSQHFIREAGIDRTDSVLKSIREELISSKRFYISIGFAVVILLVVLNNIIFNSPQEVYPSVGLFTSAIILIAGTTIQLISSLDAAILSARADNYFVRLIRGISPLLNYTFAILGALLKYPIEGFAIGFLASNIFLYFIYQNRLKTNHSDWHSIRVFVSVKQSFQNLVSLVKKGWQLYSVSVGMLIRQPVVRYVAAISLGLPAAGVLDIAMRVTTTSRDLIASGFSSLFPSFTFLYRKNERNKIVEVIRVSLLILIPVGAITAVILIFFSNYIYSLWLSESSPDLISITKILAIWQFMTIINVPFWYLLQSSHNEKIAAIAIWVHTLSIIFIIPLEILGAGLTLSSLVIYWTLSAVLTQILIYLFVEKKLSLFWIVFKNGKLLSVIIVVIVYFILATGVENINIIKIGMLPAERIILTIIFILVLFPFYFKIIKQNFGTRII